MRAHSARQTYLGALVTQLLDFRDAEFRDRLSGLFPDRTRPTVFDRRHAALNVIVRPGASHEESERVRAAITPDKRRRWFRSMKSSQALAQSVFGNLDVLQRLDVLSGVRADDEEDAFAPVVPRTATAALEYSTASNVLAEKDGHVTAIDVRVECGVTVAVECKLSEAGIGACSRPKLDEFAAEYCNGDYTRQGSRTERCALTEIGVEYWKHLPQLFQWRSDVDRLPCPLRSTYQLVRNRRHGEDE